MRRSAATATVAVVLAGLIGCGGPNAPSDNPGTPTSTGASEPATTTASTTIRIKVKAGEVVSGGGRHTVKQGSQVVIEIVSDTADEAHLHGYDETADLTPNTPSRIRFTADIPGVFELELHDAGTQLCELQVQ